MLDKLCFQLYTSDEYTAVGSEWALKQTLERTSQSVYAQIAAALRGKIQGGHWPVGTMLPSRRDLAKEYAVSPVTVDRAVTQLVRDGLLRADDRRGTFVAQFERTGAAVGAVSPLFSQRTSPATVGVIASLYSASDAHLALNNFWVRQAIQALEHTLSEKGHTTQFFNRAAGAGSPVPSLENSVKSAIAGGVDAVTIIALGADPEEIDRSLLRVESGSVPLVCISTGALSRPIPHVFYDNQSAGYEAAQELLRQGHTEILFFAPFMASWVMERLQGVHAAVHHFGLPLAVVRVWPHQSKHWQIEEDPQAIGYKAAKGVFASDVSFSGVICANDGVALGFLRAAVELGKVPGIDFAIDSFDDHPEARDFALTSIRPPMEMMGKEAARLLLQALSGEDFNIQIRCRGHLMRRASTHRRWIDRNTVS